MREYAKERGASGHATYHNIYSLPRFENFARSRPEHLTLLIDTYDTEAAARKVVALAPRLAAEGIHVQAVRLDSGDLLALSRSVREILDAGGLGEVTIFASSGLDEDDLSRLRREGAPIDGFGIGTSLTTSSDAPALDCAYKIQEYAGVARRKRSAGKATWPGRKQVWRSYGADGRMSGDVIALEDDPHAGEPLLVRVMRAGRRVERPFEITEARKSAARDLARLPEPLRRLKQEWSYPVNMACGLVRLAEQVDRDYASAEGGASRG